MGVLEGVIPLALHPTPNLSEEAHTAARLVLEAALDIKLSVASCARLAPGTNHDEALSQDPTVPTQWLDLAHRTAAPTSLTCATFSALMQHLNAVTSGRATHIQEDWADMASCLPIWPVEGQVLGHVIAVSMGER
jgi:hypothetical protein